MPEITATEAARRFADLLDSVEHDGEAFTIVRRGRAVAHLGPIRGGNGAQVKALLRKSVPDLGWAGDLAAMRALMTIEERA